jgi:mono/diheme cytochrome c family protein
VTKPCGNAARSASAVVRQLVTVSCAFAGRALDLSVMRVADLAVIGILAGGAAVGMLFLLAKRDIARTDWSALSASEAYTQLCFTCHGADGSAPTGIANTLKGKRRYWDVPRLLEYMANPLGYAQSKSGGRLGRQYMPPVPGHVPAETRERLAQFVLDTKMD